MYDRPMKSESIHTGIQPYEAETTPERRGAIGELEEQARKSLYDLDDAVRGLEKRLGKILLEPLSKPESDGINAPREAPRSEFAVMLDDLRTTARRITRQVREIIDRVDL